MTIKITLIGLGKIGTSVGLALAKHAEQIYRVGHDRTPEHSNLAKKLNAIDKVEYNLHASVANSDIVFLALPLDQVHKTFEHIAPDLREGTVVMDTAPVKQPVVQWAEEFLKPDRYYVGLTPVINAKYLLDTEMGGAGAREDLFQNGMMGLVSPPGTTSAAIQLAMDLVTLLGAKPLFLDVIEGDSLMAAVHVLPQLLAASLASITVNQPGWIEGRKLAGAMYAQSSGALIAGDTPEALKEAIQSGQVHVTRLLDAVIETLIEMRATALGEENEFVKWIQNAHTNRGQWWVERGHGEWVDQLPQTEMPTAKGELKRWFLGRRGKD